MAELEAYEVDDLFERFDHAAERVEAGLTVTSVVTGMCHESGVWNVELNTETFRLLIEALEKAPRYTHVKAA
jgi:hypothetical protein